MRPKPTTNLKPNPKILAVPLLAIVVVLAMRGPQDARDQALADSLLGATEVQKIAISDVDEFPSYRADSRVAMFFEQPGMQGLIRGVVVVEDDRIVDLRILCSHEGIGADPLGSPGFLQSFCGRKAKAPLTVDAVSGATISSQAVTDAVNSRLSHWASFQRRESADMAPE